MSRAREQLEYRLMRTLSALPAALQVRLSGRPPVRVDGDTLAPETQLTLRLLERRRRRAPGELTPEQARALRRRMAAVYAGRPEPVGAVSDLVIDAGVPLRARHYVPPGPDASGSLLVYLHGGGFTYGDLDTHDRVCRLLCRHAGTHVLAVDYRLAPEHPFPAAVEDARDALSWALANAGTLGADARAVGVGGDSAGGNLAAVAAQLIRDGGGPAPVLQLLIYPATDFTRRRRSRELFGEGFLLSNTEMDWFEDNYLGVAREHADDPRASPLLAPDLSSLPSAIVATAAFDPLRDEGEAYAQALRVAGTPTVLRRFPGFIHAFVSAAGVSRSCREAVIELAGATRALFATVAGDAARARHRPLAGPRE